MKSEALGTLVSGLLFGVYSPPSPVAALRRVEKSKFDNFSEEVRSRPGIRFISLAVTELGTGGGHATEFTY
jgi:hypothetical protein